jgi:hypothetical protein
MAAFCLREDLRGAESVLFHGCAQGDKAKAKAADRSVRPTRVQRPGRCLGKARAKAADEGVRATRATADFLCGCAASE